MLRAFLFLFLSVSLLVSCKPKSADPEMRELPEEFYSFYIQFHADSLFQMQHISFPLEGTRKAGEGSINLMIPHSWQKEEWILHKTFNDYNGSFKREFFQVGPVIIEKIADKNEFFKMERRFAKFDKEWQLIFYSVNN